MKWSWRLGRARGVDVNVHATFLIFLVWIVVASRAQGATAASTVATVLFTLAIFASVVLHEFGHVTVAQHFGVATRRITLLPIGGVAELERMPERPREELLVTLAGPAVNVAIGALLFAALKATGRDVLVAPTGLLGEGHHLARLFWVQVSLVVFNTIPAFPMDGGRVVRALLAMRVGWVRATRVAAGIGQAIALIFAFLGLFGNVFLLFIGLFVWIGAQSELAAAETKAAIAGVPSREAVEPELHSLDEDDDLAVAATRLLAGSQRDFPVMSAGSLIGVLTREALIAGLRTGGGGRRVAEVMTRNVLTVDADAPLIEVLERMHASHIPLAALTEGGAVVGLLTAENVAELILVRRALRSHDSARG